MSKKCFLSKRFFIKKIFTSKKHFAIKNFFAVKKIFTVNKNAFLILIILKEIGIMAGISNDNIVDFIKKKNSDNVKKNLLVFFLATVSQDL